MIAAAGIDLSLGSVLALSGVVGALSVTAFNLPWPVAIVACLAVGAFCGLVNGLLNAKAGIPAFIVTLGMLGVARGLGLVFTNGQPVYGMPEPLIFLGQGRPCGIPMPVFIFLAVAMIAHFVLAFTRFGKYAQVIGDNEGGRARHGHPGRAPPHRALCRVGNAGGPRRPAVPRARQCRRSDRRPQLRADRHHRRDPWRHQPVRRARQRARHADRRAGHGRLQNGLTLLAVSSFYQQMAIGAVLVLAVWLDQVNRARGQR